MIESLLPLLVMIFAALALSVGMVVMGRVLGPRRAGAEKQMPYESGVDPIHDTHRRFDVRFYMVAIAFLIFDVELLFLYPWAVARTNDHGIEAAIRQQIKQQQVDFVQQQVESGQPSLELAAFSDNAVLKIEKKTRTAVVFGSVAVFFVVLVLGLVYDWRKGVFQWR